MSNTLLTQAHKVALAGGGAARSRLSQAHKVVLLTVGDAPSILSQGHKVFLVQPGGGFRPGSIRRNGLTLRIFKGTVPVTRVYSGDSLTFAQE